MKEYIANLVKQSTSQLEGRNIAKEYLQARILGSLQRSGAMIPLAFHGGTALRFLYSHGRYSEDLDFALEGNRQNYDFRSYLQAIRSENRSSVDFPQVQNRGLQRTTIFGRTCKQFDLSYLLKDIQLN
jgi:predicted nucleotidyltransferase component of viral defense system